MIDTLSKTLRTSLAAALIASGALAVPAAIAKDTRSSAAVSKSGYSSKASERGDDRGRGHDAQRERGPRDGFPDNHGQDEACEHANGHSPSHCHNDSLG